MAINDITGDSISSKPNTKAFEDNFDKIFRRKTDEWDEKRVDVVGSNGNDGLHYDWSKHDGSRTSPVAKGTKVMIETYTPQTHIIYFSEDVNWSAIKWYKVVEEKK